MESTAKLVDIVSALDEQIDTIENHGLETAAMCLRMAKLELQMKIHGISEDEIEALCEVLRTGSLRHVIDDLS